MLYIRANFTDICGSRLHITWFRGLWWESPQNVAECVGFIQHTTQMLVLIWSFCCGSNPWRNCLYGFQLAKRTAPLYPCLPRGKLFSKPRSPETAPKGKKWDMDHQRGGCFTSIISAPWHPVWDVSAGTFWKEGSSPGKISFCWPVYTHGSKVLAEVRIRSWRQMPQL